MLNYNFSSAFKPEIQSPLSTKLKLHKLCIFLNYPLNHCLHNTKHCLHNTKIKTKAAENSFRHFLPKIINTTSPSILQKISTHSFQGFVFYRKQHLVQSYEDHCSLSNFYVLTDEPF